MVDKFDASADIQNSSLLAALEGSKSLLSVQSVAPAPSKPAPSISFGLK